ncbi:TetR/AcrR family transcriptional regulator [Aestuariivirga sp.]|jgi:AcrR family transcriptional regulator|uniref:TetR/AcrR family transcriptional regulator n=1 Tax=Aestuariivirga sp. TaxID=2650926 RepID=UPI003782F47C
MTRKRDKTRQRLLEAAETLIAEESLAQLKIDRITERAGVSRRTFFLHFPSKDHLLAAIMGHLRPGYVDRYRALADSRGPDASLEARLVCLFEAITASALDPEWRGSFFIRIASELGHLRGHPVHAVVAAANRDMEAWLADELRTAGHADADGIARQLLVLINGLMMVQLITRSPAYGEDAIRLVRTLLARS